MTTSVAGGYRQKVIDRAEDILRDAGIGLTGRLPMPRENISSTYEYRLDLELYEGMRRLDAELAKGRYYGAVLEKQRWDVLVKLYERASYQKIVNWWRRTTGETVSCNTVRNFAETMVRVGLLAPWVQDRKRYRVHGPRDISIARFVIKNGVHDRHSIGQICKTLRESRRKKPCSLFHRARREMVAEGELAPRPFHHKRLELHRNGVARCVRDGMSFPEIARYFGVGLSTVTRYVCSLVTRGDLPMTVLVGAKMFAPIAGYLDVIVASVERGMNVKQIQWRLCASCGVIAATRTVSGVVGRVQLATGIK